MKVLKKILVFSLLLLLAFPALCQAGPASDPSVSSGGPASSDSASGSSYTSGSGTANRVTLLAAGDNLIHHQIYNMARQADGSFDFNFLYDRLRERISSYDLAVINQETILVSDPALIDTFPCFGTPDSMADALVNAGFDVVLSATNHTWDKKETGVRNTLDYWANHFPQIPILGIHPDPADASSVDFLEKNNIRFALFNYTYGLNGFRLPAGKTYMVDLLQDQGKFLSDVRAAEQEADFTICFLHIGEEYRFAPTAYQVNYINSLIDAGADLVICAHPHVVEPYGQVTTAAGNSALVFYSCGNFVSFQTRLERVLGGLADVTIVKDETGTHIDSFDFIPVVTHFDGTTETVLELKDYTEEMAITHYIRQCLDPGFSAAALRGLWTRVTGRPVE